MANESTKSAKVNGQLSVEEVSEKFNGGRKIIDFTGHSKIFFGISIAIIVIGIICNFIFGTPQIFPNPNLLILFSHIQRQELLLLIQQIWLVIPVIMLLFSSPETRLLILTFSRHFLKISINSILMQALKFLSRVLLTLQWALTSS